MGVLLVELAAPWARSLKEKRAAVLPVTERLKARYPVSVARLSGANDQQRELIGVSALSNDGVWLEGLLGRVLAFIEAKEVVVLRSQVDIEQWEFDAPTRPGRL